MKDYFATTNPAVPRPQHSELPPDAHHGDGNVQGGERLASAAGGAALLYLGLRRGGLLGMLGAVIGGGLLARGISGRCAAKRALSPSPEEKQLAMEHGWNTAAAAIRSITINRPRQEVYDYWRNFENLARFMRNISHIEVIDSKRSRWLLKAPFGQQLEWVSHVIEDIPGERIAWETEYDADVRSTGWVEFRDAPGGRGTEVRAMIAYEPPGGRLGHLAARLWKEDPNSRAQQDLHRLKQILETGEAVQPNKMEPKATSPDSEAASAGTPRPSSESGDAAFGANGRASAGT